MTKMTADQIRNAGAESALKEQAALRAASLVKSGQRVGLGTGSTTLFVIRELGRRRREEGLDIECAATSFQSALLAREQNLPLYPLQSFRELDISLDGADEIDPALRLIKGGGAAHTLEKIVHALSRRFIVVVDHTKKVSRLGEKFAVPLEIIPESLGLVEHRLRQLGAEEVALRKAMRKDGPVISDNGNLILDARFQITDPESLERDLNSIPGVVENGIFARPDVLPSGAVIATPDGLEERGI